MGFWDIIYYYGVIIALVMMVVSLIISARCKSAFKKYSKQAVSNGMTGAMAAQYILQANGITDVTIQHISGDLTDNYSPKDKTLNLSDSVYNTASVAAVGVAAHECGHAIQHHVGYTPNKVRSLLVPLANLGSKLGPYVAIIGAGLMGYLNSDYADNALGSTIFYIGILMFSFAVLFYLVTLPVEFNASHRALKILQGSGLLQGKEVSGARSVLSAAAMTYVAAAASAIITLLRLVSYGKRRN